ncbi:MAG TPA: hypothetical protein VH256_05955 [Thermoleophilaceae bacterium]|jgi:hypothetical protein|nr:hypothetical protein [Thermoleophilaceae bacterium]
MDPIQPIASRIPSLPAVEPAGHRVDPEKQKREQQRRQQQHQHEQREHEEPEEDDGLPHIDISV